METSRITCEPKDTCIIHGSSLLTNIKEGYMYDPYIYTFIAENLHLTAILKNCTKRRSVAWCISKACWRQVLIHCVCMQYITSLLKSRVTFTVYI